MADKTPKAEEPKDTTATVVAHSGAVIRVYTQEVHGDDFKDLAMQMAAQHKDSKIVLS